MLPDRALVTDEIGWLNLHGLDIYAPRNTRIDVDCSALDTDGRCSLVGMPQRPRMCINYPEHPGLDPACSYRFEKVA